eukprot:COSAG05_NODE_532_length_8897_cov_18.622301_6_plen_72_part_00
MRFDSFRIMYGKTFEFKEAKVNSPPDPKPCFKRNSPLRSMAWAIILMEPTKPMCPGNISSNLLLVNHICTN